jgi:hypothetical protein
VTSTRGDEAHTLEPLYERGRRPGKPVSVAELPAAPFAPCVNPASPAKREAVAVSGGKAPQPNLSHGNNGCGDGDGCISITVARCGTRAARP